MREKPVRASESSQDCIPSGWVDPILVIYQCEVHISKLFLAQILNYVTNSWWMWKTIIIIVDVQLQ